MKKYNVAVVGVGAVGEELLRVLRQRAFPVGELRVFARSSREIVVDNEKFDVQQVSPEGFSGIDIALFAGTEGEKGAAVTFAAEAIKRGAVVIDNGADFRLREDVPLVVPEVNPQDVSAHKGIIANPNCSTVQLVAAVAPIHREAGIKRMIVSTYQAVSGAGRQAITELTAQTSELLTTHPGDLGSDCNLSADVKVFPRRIAFNVIPHIGSFQDAGYTTEEWKMVQETHKILHDEKIKISATTARVPVIVGHSQAVYLETRRKIALGKVRKLLQRAKGIRLVDDPKGPDARTYPVPLDAAGKDDVLIGRVRPDPFVPKGLWLWVVADNLRKGAALNAVQIAELLIKPA
ncbi:MAG: aspartate-semialdehyde dehydrogenase [Candidatus Omnitrophota bacterium]